MALVTVPHLNFRTSVLFQTKPRSNPLHSSPLQYRNFSSKPLVIKARENTRTENPKVRNRRLQRKFNGTSVRPRLSVFCSTKQLYAMLVDDQNKKLLFYGSTLQKSIRENPTCSTAEAAQSVGEELIKACIDLKINEISSYDRNGFARGERMQAFEIAISQHGFLPRKMEQAEEIGIKIYNAAPPEEPSPYPSSPQLAVPETHRKRRAVAKGVQKTLSKTSMLVNFLPTGTLLTFEMVLPSVSGNGQCSPVSTMMIHVLMGLCALSCFFFHFTDSYKGPDGKVYYGFVTPKGLAVFKPGLGLEIPKEERFKVGFTDFVHALMSVMVFLAIAFSDHRITDCLFPRHVKEMDEVMESFPLMVGIICSGLFLVFPNTRYGIGCMAS